ncbi:DUF4434 domain-containing protein [Enterovibrio sp. 27052020O]|uniref:DUF4434 domain-containing protein n=1 Tax=Enterovibrio sp. 27052020O TaxID=3241166 RepID=UPI00388D093E
MAAHHRQRFLPQNKYRRCLYVAALLALLTSVSFASASTVYYQPLNMDKQLTDREWAANLDSLRGIGIESGVIQWVQYGDETFGETNGWLAQRMQMWTQRSPVWLGLYADPEYFSRIDQPANQQAKYLDMLLDKNAKTLSAWQTWVSANTNNVQGYYLPMELSDYYFRTPASQQVLKQQLTHFTSKLDKPLAISVFASGTLSPSAFNKWLISLTQTGVHIWLQDGQGTQALPIKTRQAYFNVLACDVGVISELFIQTSVSPFHARPMTNEERSTANLSIKPCHQKLSFSLRYLRPIPHPLPLP